MKRILLTVLLLTSIMFAQGGYSFYNPTFWRTGTTANSISYMDGNVGIGNTAPSYKLDVYSNSLGALLRVWEDGSNGRAATINMRAFSGNNGYIQMNGTTYPSTSHVRNNILEIGTSGAYNIGFSPNNTLAATITSAGNVGIANASPSYTLDVTGKGRFTDSLRALVFVTTSDTTLKTNMQNITDWNLSNFKDVHPITYNFKPDLFAQYDSLGNITNQEYVDQMTAATQNGFKAQEFGKLIKGLDGQKNLTTMDLIIALWLKNQELETRIKALENK